MGFYSWKHLQELLKMLKRPLSKLLQKSFRIFRKACLMYPMSHLASRLVMDALKVHQAREMERFLREARVAANLNNS
uniref:Uncharacterized protein n=1 Tax=Cannabis sativa TaxID=3483 RepID=A0A803RBC6_CANSA